MPKFTGICIIVLFLLSLPLYSQTGTLTEVKQDTFHIDLRNVYPLTGISLIPGSEIVRLHGRVLSRPDYSINPQTLVLALSDSLPYSLFDTLFVSYRSLKLDLHKEYQFRKLVRSADPTLRDSALVSKQLVNLSTESIFGRGIEKSGSIIRGFTVGTNKDLTLQSGFRLQLSGKLSDDVELVAALTDENSPIQPEGNTERLDELDKIFIQVRHKNAELTFGDYELKHSNGEFGTVNRKLQGIYSELRYGDNTAFLAYATAKGKFQTNALTGVDGVQGPYQLTGTNNSKDIIVIAGSERVYLNGQLLKRGEQNDYTVDYANSQITFTPARLMTTASRIVVEFEFTDRFYSRTFFGAGIKSKFMNGKASVGFSYYREGDNPDAPIDITLSDSDKTILRNAGNDPTKAVKTGITLVQPDSLGNRSGTYERIDTVINTKPYTFYRYNPGTPGAIYQVTFSYVGAGTGAYSRQGPGWFQFIGPGQGDYEPIVFLPLPTLKQLMNLVFNYEDSTVFSLQMNASGSSFDQNRFSSIGDTANQGYAYNISLQSKKIVLPFYSGIAGTVTFNARERFMDRKFNSLERVGDVEFSRLYNAPESSGRVNERLQEAGFAYELGNLAAMSMNYGALSQEELLTSKRVKNIFSLSPYQGLRINYDLDYVTTKTPVAKTDWTRLSARTAYEGSFIKPSLSVLYENKIEKPGASDSLTGNSLKYTELTPGFGIIPFQNVIIGLSYVYRDDYAPLSGTMLKESNSRGYSVDAEIRPSGAFQSTWKLTSRVKTFTDEFRQNGSLNSDVLLIKSQTRINPFQQLNTDIYYEASSQKSALLQRVFIPVTKGTGTYRYVGDLNNNGVKDENEFEPTTYDGDYALVTIPSDQLFPVIDLKSSARIRWSLNKVLHEGGFWRPVADAFSFESYARIEENSKDQKVNDIYLMKLSRFLDPVNTIRGSQSLQQSIYVFENKNDLSLRFQYTQNKNLSTYGSGTEQGYKREQSIRIKFQMVQEIGNQTDLIRTADDLNAPGNQLRNRKLEKDGFTSDFSYRPEQWIESGFVIGVSRTQDYFPVNPTVLNANSQLLRFNFTFGGYGRLHLELERSELTVNRTDNYLPYEMTNGNAVGKNYYIRMSFDYRISTNLQATANYDGREQGGNPFVHTARAEVRAFF